MPDRISFTTDDGLIIVGTWTEAAQARGAAILLHMMPATRASWSALQSVLSSQGLSSLAIDLRGHGESVVGDDGKTTDYKSYTDEQHQAARFDVDGAIAWVREKGFDLGRIVLIGASFGADLALSAIADEPSIPGAVLFSPGEYRGISAVDEAQGLNYDQSLYIIASSDDTQSFADSQRLQNEAPIERKEFITYTDAGHGTAILDKDPSRMAQVATWILSILRG